MVRMGQLNAIFQYLKMTINLSFKGIIKDNVLNVPVTPKIKLVV